MATRWRLKIVILIGITIIDVLSATGLVTHRPILTGIAVNQTITLTCYISGGSAHSVGWYRNKGRKVISIGYVNNSCETSPPELPFSAKCLCLNITVYSCTLTVDPSMHDEDEWECSFADNGLSIKSNGIRIEGSNVSRTETGENPFFVDVQKGSVVVAVLPKHENDIIVVQVNDVSVASCTFKSKSAEIIELKNMELYNIFLTPSGMCLLTIFNFNGTQLAVKISSTKGFEKVIIDGKAYPHRTGSVDLDFILRGKEGHKQKDEKNWSIRGWIGVLIGVLLFGIAIENAIVYFIWKNCYKSQRVTANGTPHDGESNDERQGDDQRLTVENGEIQQNGGTPGNRIEEIGRRSSIVEYLRNCFS